MELGWIEPAALHAATGPVRLGGVRGRRGPCAAWRRAGGPSFRCRVWIAGPARGPGGGPPSFLPGLCPGAVRVASLAPAPPRTASAHRGGQRARGGRGVAGRRGSLCPLCRHSRLSRAVRLDTWGMRTGFTSCHQEPRQKTPLRRPTWLSAAPISSRSGFSCAAWSCPAGRGPPRSLGRGGESWGRDWPMAADESRAGFFCDIFQLILLGSKNITCIILLFLIY